MIVRIVLHSAALAVLNLFGVWLGFVAHALSPGSGQLAVQLPVAFAVTVAGFALWIVVVNARGPRWLRIREWWEGAWIFVLVPVWAALVFVPVHYVTQGYLTAFSNLVALWSFQGIPNLIALALGLTILGGRGERDPRGAGADRTAV